MPDLLTVDAKKASKRQVQRIAERCKVTRNVVAYVESSDGSVDLTKEIVGTHAKVGAICGSPADDVSSLYGIQGSTSY